MVAGSTAQTRAFHFSKFGQDIPHLLGAECGPNTLITSAFTGKEAFSEKIDCVDNRRHPPGEEVRTIVHTLVGMVPQKSADYAKNSFHHTSLPPPLLGEYDTILPVTSKGLLMNVGELDGAVSFLGYRPLDHGVKGPAEVQGLIREVGDVITAINGQSVIGRTFAEVIQVLKKSTTFAYLRFTKKAVFIQKGDFTSCGTRGKCLAEDLMKTFKEDRRRLLAKRSLALLVQNEKEDDDSDASEVPNESDEDSDGSASEDVEPDSEDEDLVFEQHVKRRQSESGESEKSDTDYNSDGNSSNPQSSELQEKTRGEVTKNEAQSSTNIPSKQSNEEEKKTSEFESNDVFAEAGQDGVKVDTIPKLQQKTVKCKQESTRFLAYKLLDMDVGYSSDEGGDEDIAYFVSNPRKTKPLEKSVL